MPPVQVVDGVLVVGVVVAYDAALQVMPVTPAEVWSWPLTQPVYESTVTVGFGSP